MVSEFKRQLREIGWRTLVGIQRISQPRSQRIWKSIHAVVFESDDWGWCAFGRDRKALEELTSLGYDVSNVEYSNTLESEDDLKNLFTTLYAAQDVFGHRAVFTPNFIVSNPDFAAIKTHKFETYMFIPISKGFPGSWNVRGEVKKEWLSGLHKRVWWPEYHGFAHFDYLEWIRLLRRGNRMVLDFFDREMIPLVRNFSLLGEYGKVGARKFFDLEHQRRNIKAGCSIFQDVFGYLPDSAISPDWLYNDDTLAALTEHDIHFLQDAWSPMSVFSFQPSGPKRMLRMVRNIDLEPRGMTNSAMSAQKAIERTAFLFKIGMPAIVNTHRINYVGGINPALPYVGLRELAEFLKFLQEDEQVAFLTASEAFQLSARGYSLLDWGDQIVLRNYRRDSITFDLTPFKAKSFSLASGMKTRPVPSKIDVGPCKTITIE